MHPLDICGSCIHNSVCKLRDEYIKVQKKNPTLDLSNADCSKYSVGHIHMNVTVTPEQKGILDKIVEDSFTQFYAQADDQTSVLELLSATIEKLTNRGNPPISVAMSEHSYMCLDLHHNIDEIPYSKGVCELIVDEDVPDYYWDFTYE